MLGLIDSTVIHGHSLKSGLDPGLDWTLDFGLDSGLWTLDSEIYLIHDRNVFGSFSGTFGNRRQTSELFGKSPNLHIFSFILLNIP